MRLENKGFSFEIKGTFELWCDHCEKVTSHSFKDQIIKCCICNKQRVRFFLNNDNTFDRFFLFSSSEKATISILLKKEKERWNSVYPDEPDKTLTQKMMVNMIEGLKKSLKRDNN